MRLFQFRYSAERDLVELMLKVSIGASGAPTIQNGKGIVSMVRNSAGNYTISLKDPYYLLMEVSQVSISGSSAPAAPMLNVVSEQVNNNTSPSLIVQFRDVAAAAADPANGEVIMMRITLRSAST